MDRRQARAGMEELQRLADGVCRLIVFTDYPRVDVEIERERVRWRCEDLFPDRLDLYDMIYESRFDRLWEQFREPEERDGD
jgi:hypothetical protein